MARGRKHIGDVSVAPKNSIGDTTKPPLNSIGDTHPVSHAPAIQYTDPGLGGAGWTTESSDYKWNFGTAGAPNPIHNVPAGVTIALDPSKCAGRDVEVTFANTGGHTGFPSLCTQAYLDAVGPGGSAGYAVQFTTPDDTFQISGVYDFGPYTSTGSETGNVPGSNGWTALPSNPVAYVVTS